VYRRFSDIVVETLPIPGAGRKDYWERPLGVRVTSKGTKTFIVMLGSGHRHTIGRVGSISLKDARTEAMRLKADHQPKKYKAPPVSLSTARTAYFAAAQLRPGTRMYYTRYLAMLPDMPLDHVEHRHIIRILDAVPRSCANLALKTITTFFNWCVPRYIKHSPCTGLKAPNKTTPRSRVLSDDELRAIYQVALNDGGTFSKIMILLMLTGLRRTECAVIEKSWISISNATISIPPNVTKNGRLHVAPFSALTASIIKQQLSSDEKTPYIFPVASSSQPFTNWSRSKADLDKACGVRDWVIHDLRRSYASNHARVGTPIHIIERLLNHITGSISGIAAIYNRHSYAAECRAAQEKYEQFFVEKILGQPCSNH
jgi:integrase